MLSLSHDILFCSWVLNLVAKECWEQDGCAYHKQTGSYQRQYGLGNSIFPCVHLDVYLQSGYNHHHSSDSVCQIQHIQHHRHHIVVHPCQCVCSPAIVHITAFGWCGQGSSAKTKELTTFFIIWLNFILDWYCFDVWLSWLCLALFQ